MNTFQRKLIPAFIVAALAAVPFCGITAADYSSAGDTNANVEADIEYTMSDDGTYAIASKCLNKETATTATIASTYDGVSVTTIGDDAFYRCGSLTSVIIPDSVTTISIGAFWGCGSLTSVIIPDSVTTISIGAFQGCSSLTSVIIPDSVTTIDNAAFCECTSLKSINIPSTVTRIGADALCCPNLERIITTLDIQPGTYGSPSTSNVGVEAEIIYTMSDDGTYAIVSGCSNEETATMATIESTYNGVPVTKIDGFAFYGCRFLRSVTIPDSVTKIGDSAFCECTSLRSVTIPDSVTKIGVDALCCPNLEKIITTLDIQPGTYGSPFTVSIVRPQCTISFDAGDGFGAAPSVTAGYGSTAYLPSSGFTRVGYTFAGWTTTIDGTTVYYPIGSFYTFYGDDGSTRTFTARYVANYNDFPHVMFGHDL